MRYRVEIGSQSFEVEVRRTNKDTEVVVDGQAFPLEELRELPSIERNQMEDGGYRVNWNDRSLDVFLHSLVDDGEQTGGKKATNLDQAQKFYQGGHLLAPMPGNVLSVVCSKGQQVVEGDLLLVLEAMKMENEIVAPTTGTVRKVLVQEGQAVAYNDQLVELD